MKIFEALRKDHDTQRALLKLIADSKDDSSARLHYYQQLKEELTKHAVAEKHYFYEPLLKSNATIGMSRHGLLEHNQIDTLMTSLDKIDIGSDTWSAGFELLALKIEKHLTEEEQTNFKKASEVLNENQTQLLAQEYLKEMAY